MNRQTSRSEKQTKHQEAMHNIETAINKRQGTSRSQFVLDRLRRRWEEQSQVRTDSLARMVEFDPEGGEDFLETLLPFKDHPIYQALPQETKSKILSCGWLAYNEKTVDIETKIVTPACLHMLSNQLPDLHDWSTKEAITEAMTDEAYHVLLVVNANRITRKHRDLESLEIGEFELATQLEKEKARHPEPWQKVFIQVATCIVSEIFISDYLKLLSAAEDIQPINRLMVETHWRDELVHGTIFKELTRLMHTEMTNKQKDFFKSILPKPVLWFGSYELDVWENMLKQLNIKNYKSMIEDIRHGEQKENLANMDYKDLIALCEELEIIKTQSDYDFFRNEGVAL